MQSAEKKHRISYTYSDEEWEYFRTHEYNFNRVVRKLLAKYMEEHP